jgi:hypothetical protein
LGPGGIGAGEATAVHFGAGRPESVWLVIFTSADAVSAVIEGELAIGPLLPGVLSVNAGSFSAALPLTVNVWLEASVQVTVQLNGTAVGVDTASDPLDVAGLGLPVVQSPGRASVAVVSVIVGPVGPLLWTPTEPVTGKGTPTPIVGGEETDADVALMSTVTGQTPGVEVSGPTAMRTEVLPPSGTYDPPPVSM